MKVRVRHDAVGLTVAHLALSVREFEEQLAALDSEVDRLRSSWNGDARRSYERAQAEWTAALSQMKALLAEATRRLATVHGISMETSSSASAVWR